MASANVGELTVGLKFENASLEKSIKESENKILKFADVAKNALVTAVVQKGLDVATNAAKNFAGGIVETGKTFQASMSEVAAISGATGDDLAMLEQTARDFGSTTQFSASEAADALKYMALAGWDANQSSSALGGVLDLAAASGMDLAQASDMVTDYLTAFGMEASQSAYFADMLAYAQANSNTTAEALGEAYKNCAANLNAAGQDVETTTSLLAMMANQGLKGSEAGTALNAVMRDMTARMKDGAITIGDTSVAVMDANGNYRDLTDIMRDVESATTGMGDAEKAAALSSTFTADSIKGLNLIMNAGVDEAAAFEEALRGSDGTAKAMADTMNDNLEGKLKSLNSKFEELQIQLFNNLEPVLNVVIDLLGWCADHADVLVPILVSLGATIATVFVVDKINQFASKTKSIFDSIGNVFSKFKNKTVEVAASVSESSNNLSTSTDKIASSGESLSTRLSNAIKGIADVVSTVFQSLGQILGSVVDAVMEPIKRLLTGIGEAIAGFFEALASPQVLIGVAVFTAAAAGIAAAILLIGSAIGAVTPALSDFLNSVLIPLAAFIVETLIIVMSEVTDCIIRLMNDAIIPFATFIRDTVIEVMNAVTDATIRFTNEALIPFGEFVRDTLIDIINNITDAIVELTQNALIPMGEFIRDTLIAIIDSITDAIIRLTNEAVIPFGEFLRDTLTNVLNTITDCIIRLTNEAIIPLGEFIRDTVIDIINTLTDAIIRLTNEAIIPLINKVMEFGDWLLEKIEYIVNNIKDTLNDFITWIDDHIITPIKELPKKMLEIGENLVKGLWDGISNMVGWIGEKVSGFVNGIVDKFKDFFGIHSPSTLFRDEVGKYMAEGIGVGFTDEMENVSEEMARSVELPNMSVDGYGGWTEAVIGLTTDEEDTGSTGVGSDVKITQYNTIENGFDVEQMNAAMLSAMRGV